MTMMNPTSGDPSSGGAKEMILANVKSKANMHGRIEESMVPVRVEAHANNLKSLEHPYVRQGPRIYQDTGDSLISLPLDRPEGTDSSCRTSHRPRRPGRNARGTASGSG